MSMSERRRFLHDELFSMTLMATVQRGHVYSSRATAPGKAAFQAELRRQLEATAATYTATTTDPIHEENIVSLAASLSMSHGATLLNGRFRIGSAQKALNLFLKYLWCVGEMPEPPHCPFDSQIIKKLPRAARCKWTEVDSIETYRELVTAARTVAAGRSLAQWELAEYNRA
jgi:hypothetical protein